MTQKFNGALHVQGGTAVPVNINNALLRGCTLRNTEYVLGLVVNTGYDTKVMMGLRKPIPRDSTLGKTMNRALPPERAPTPSARAPRPPHAALSHPPTKGATPHTWPTLTRA